MRLQLITLLTTFVLVHAYAGGYSQITLHEKNTRLEVVFKSIEHQTDFIFLYDRHDLKDIAGITVDLQQASIEDAMTTALKNLPLTYKIVDKTVLVKKKEAEATGPVTPPKAVPPAPPIKISGRVMNAEDNAPLPGASVRVLNSKLETLTDAEGNFTLTVPEGSKVLIVSYVGFGVQQVTLTDTKNYTVKLTISSKQMAEVVVTDGYATQSKKSYTGASAVVSGALNENKPFTTPQAALQANCLASTPRSVAVNRAPTSRSVSGASTRYRWTRIRFMS